MKLLKSSFLFIIVTFLFTFRANAFWNNGTVTEYPNHSMCEYQLSEGNVLKIENGPVASASISAGSDYTIADDNLISMYLSGHYSCYDPLYIVITNENGKNVIHSIQLTANLDDYQRRQEENNEEDQYLDITEEEYYELWNNGWPGVTCTYVSQDFELILAVGSSCTSCNTYEGIHMGLASDPTFYGNVSYIAGGVSRMTSGFTTASGNYHCIDHIYYYNDGAGGIGGFTTEFDPNSTSTNEASLVNSSFENYVSNATVQQINYIRNATEQPNQGGGNPEYGDPIYEDNEVFNFCNQWRVLKVFNVLHIFINIARILIPLIIIIMASIDLFKVFTSGDEKELKNSINKFIRRAIIGISVFFIPMIVKIPIDMIDRSDGQFSRCNICFDGDSDECNSIIESLKD